MRDPDQQRPQRVSGEPPVAPAGRNDGPDDATGERLAAVADLRATDILESIAEGFFTLDRQWRFDFVNREAQRILRTARARRPGHWDGYRAWTAASSRARTSHDGQREAVSFTAYYPAMSAGTKCTRTPPPTACRSTSATSPTAERAQASASGSSPSRRRQRRIYEAALSSTPDFVYVFDLDHRFIYANEALLRMWGRRRTCSARLPRAGLRAVARRHARPRDRAGDRHARADPRRDALHRHQRAGASTTTSSRP